METVLVTGGAGAIGSNLSNRLLELGYRVVVIDDLSSGKKELLNDRVILIKGSVTKPKHLQEAFSYKPRYVFHLAALFANQNSVLHPKRDLNANGIGILNVLEYCKEYNIKKILFTSSSCVYGNSTHMEEETQSDDFDTPYAITKYLGEKYFRFWAAYHKLDTVIVRLFNSYGPGEFPGRYRNVIPNFFNLAIKNQPLPITGTGEEIRDFNFVGDTLDGIMKAMFQQTSPGEIFNLASGKGTKIIDLAQMINQITCNSKGIFFLERRNWDSVNKRIGIIDKAVNRLGYSPKTGIFSGLTLTHQWFKNIHRLGNK